MPVENHHAEHHPTSMINSDLVAIVTNPTTNPQISLIRFDDFAASVGGFAIPPFTYAAYNDSRIVGALQASNNLSDLDDPAEARTNLGISGDMLPVGTTPGTVAAGDDSRITGAAQKASNLSDLPDPSAARDNLELGDAALLDVGTSTGTVAAGNDTRITGAAQKSANLSDLADSPTARTNLGLGGSATLNVGTSAGSVAAGDDSRITGAAQKSANLSDLGSTSTAKTNLGLGNVENTALSTWAGSTNITTLGTILAGTVPVARISGLGTAATKNVGTTAGTVAAGDDSRLNALTNPNRVTFSDANVSSVATTTRILAQVGTMTAARTVTMPLASTFTAGSGFRLIDESGTVSASNTITLLAQGSDRINTTLTQLVINTANGWVDLESDGVSKWTYKVDQVSAPTVVTSINVESMYNPFNPVYGAVGGTADDYQALFDCLTAAAANNGSVYIPYTIQISKTINIPTAGFKQPYVVSVNTSTSTLTFSQDPGGTTGDPIQLLGTCPTGISRNTQYYRNFPTAGDRTKVILYDTRPNALAGGSTGKIIVTSDVRVTGSISTSSRTLTITSGTELGTENGTCLLISGASGQSGTGGFWIIGGGGTGTLTLSSTSSASSSSSNNVTYVCYVDNRSFDGGLKIVGAPGAYIKKHANWTSISGTPLLRAAIGSNVEIHGLGFEGLSSQFIPRGVTGTLTFTTNPTISITISGPTDWALPGVAFSLNGGSNTYYVQSVSGSTLTAWKHSTLVSWPSSSTYTIGQGISSGIVGITATGSSGASSVVVNDTRGLYLGLGIYFAGDTNGAHNITAIDTNTKTVTFDVTAAFPSNPVLSTNLTDAALTAVAGDDGLNLESVQGALVEKCYFRHFGDSALRTCSNVAYYQGKTTTYPYAGVSSTQVTVRDCDFYNIYQTSTTTNNYMVGGGRDVLFDNNVFDYLRGSVKFAGRVAGSRNIKITRNIIKSSDNHGFECDSQSDLFIEGNTVMNVLNQGIFILPNNGLTNVSGITATTTASNSTVVVTSNSTLKAGMTGNISGTDGSGSYQTMAFTIVSVTDATHVVISPTPSVSLTGATISVFGLGIVGSPMDGLYIRNNILDNCGQSPNTSSILITPDVYSDGYKFTYKNGDISGNTIRNVNSTTHIGIHLSSGSYQGWSIDKNKFHDFQGLVAIQVKARGETASGFINSIRLLKNEIIMNNVGASSFGIRFETTSGTQPLNDITMDNEITGTCARRYALGGAKGLNNVKLLNLGKAGLGPSGHIIFTGTVQNLTVDGEYLLSRTTSDATPSSLLWDTTTSTSKPILQNNQLVGFLARITGRDTSGNCGIYEVRGGIKRGANAAATAIVGSVTVTTIAEDTSGWDVTAVADTTNGALDIQVTGAAATTIRWTGRVVILEQY